MEPGCWPNVWCRANLIPRPLIWRPGNEAIIEPRFLPGVWNWVTHQVYGIELGQIWNQDICHRVPLRQPTLKAGLKPSSSPPTPLLPTNLGTQFCLLIDLHVNGEVPLLGHQLGQINWKAIGVIQPPGHITCRGEREERERGNRMRSTKKSCVVTQDLIMKRS